MTFGIRGIVGISPVFPRAVLIFRSSRRNQIPPSNSFCAEPADYRQMQHRPGCHNAYTRPPKVSDTAWTRPPGSVFRRTRPRPEIAAAMQLQTEGQQNKNNHGSGDPRIAGLQEARDSSREA